MYITRMCLAVVLYLVYTPVHVQAPAPDCMMVLCSHWAVGLGCMCSVPCASTLQSKPTVQSTSILDAVVPCSSEHSSFHTCQEHIGALTMCFPSQGRQSINTGPPFNNSVHFLVSHALTCKRLVTVDPDIAKHQLEAGSHRRGE